MANMDDLIRFDVTNEAIAVLAEKFKDLSALTHYAEVAKAALKVAGYRIRVEHTRKALKADALEHGRRVDKEAKRIFALLAPIEDQLKEKKAAVDDAKKRAAQAELDRIADEKKAAIEREREEMAAGRKALDEERAAFNRERAAFDKEHAAETPTWPMTSGSEPVPETPELVDHSPKILDEAFAPLAGGGEVVALFAPSGEVIWGGPNARLVGAIRIGANKPIPIPAIEKAFDLLVVMADPAANLAASYFSDRLFAVLSAADRLEVTHGQ